MSNTHLQNTLAELIRINSVNAFYEHGPGEAAIAAWIGAFFRERGLEVVEQLVLEGHDAVRPRCNVIACLPGKRRDKRIVLEAHMDTVSITGMTIPPFEPSIEGRKMFGRGSCDTKAGLAAMMHAVVDLHQQGIQPECDVWMAAVVDEEFSFRGVLKLVEDLNADAAIVAEPTELKMVIASKGVLRWRIVARGKAAHSSKTHLGINAIHHMARLVVALEEHHAMLRMRTHPLLGSASGNVGKIHGGVQVNFVPDLCAIEIDRRLLPQESLESVLREYQRIVDEVGANLVGFDVTMEAPMLVDPAWINDPKDSVVRFAGECLAEMGLDPGCYGVPFGSDASKFGRAGISTLLFGPGSIDQAHAAVEYVDLDQVEQAFDFYRRFIRGYQPETIET